MEDNWPPETFWCAVQGERTWYAGSSRRQLGVTRTWLAQHYSVPVWHVWVTIADTREEADAKFAQWTRDVTTQVSDR